MRLYDISQAVILDGQNPVGIVDESQCCAVVADQEAWERPVCEVMSTNLKPSPRSEHGRLVAYFCSRSRGYCGFLESVFWVNHPNRPLNFLRKTTRKTLWPTSNPITISLPVASRWAISRSRDRGCDAGGVFFFDLRAVVSGEHAGFEYSRSHNPTRYAWSGASHVWKVGTYRSG